MQRRRVEVSRPAAMIALVLAAVVGAAATLFAGGVMGVAADSQVTRIPIYVAAQAQTTGSGGGIATEGYAPMVRRVLPTVVNISSSRVRTTQQRRGAPGTPGSDPFREFFGDRFAPPPQERREQGLGSGVVVSPEGYIITNNHVIEGASEVRVRMQDGRELPAKTIGRDPNTDIAVLKIEAKDLQVITMGDSDRVEPGQIAIAMGNPFGLDQTVTMGIVSAVGRGGLGIEDYEDFIQTDAAINPGNSGGALVNTRGELIGINTAILAGQGGGNRGIGFAVPVNMARGVMDQLIRSGRVTRGYIGATVQDVTPQLAQSFGLENTRGALIGDVVADGPAAKAGVQRGDIVTRVNDQNITSSRQLRLLISQMQPGANVRLGVLRNGQQQTIQVNLGELPTDASPAAPEEAGPEDRALQGFAVQPLTPQILRQLQLPPGTRGVVVSQVEPGSPAERAGLRRGDVIQEVNRKPVASERELRAAARGSDAPVLLLVNRGGTTLFLALQP
jgi:serine protease Do